MVPDGWVATPLPTDLSLDCPWSNLEEQEYQVHAGAGEIQITRQPSGRVAIPKGLEARMDLELGRVPALRYVFEYREGWLAFSEGEWISNIEWWDRSLSSGRAITIGDRSVPQDVVRAAASGDEVLVLQVPWLTGSGGQLAALRREGDHFTSRVIARYDSGPLDMLPQPDGSWLVLTKDAVWRTLRTGSVELVVHLPEVPQSPTSLAADGEGRLYIGGRVGVLRLTPRWDTSLRYLPDLLLPKNFSLERCSSAWFAEPPYH